VPVTHASDSPTWQLPGTVFTGLASPSRGDSSETAVWRIKMRAGTPATAHSVTRTEVFVALAGTAQVRIAGRTEMLTSGDTLVVPANTVFELSAPGRDDFEAVVSFPVGGQAAMPGADPFTPPWAQ
jgi:mannose-6-phosphate isomerase-like protein (cupin superfamily)